MNEQGLQLGDRMRRLGTSDIEISPIGLGCWQFSESRGVAGSYWPALPGEVVRDIVAVSLEEGVSWFDTAEAYGEGRSEQVLSRTLQDLEVAPGTCRVATKWTPLPWRTARSIVHTVDRRQACLAPYPIDLHQVHAPVGSLSTHAAQMRAMAELVEAGAIGAVGISNFPAGAMRRCHRVLADRGVPLVSNQVQYSLLDRGIERNGVLGAAKELGITIIAYSPLGQGLLSGKFHDDPDRVKRLSGMRRWRPRFWRRSLRRSAPVVEALKRVAAAHDATPAQVALAWLVQFHGDTVVAIPGASRAEQARDNARALQIELTRPELETLDRVSRG